MLTRDDARHMAQQINQISIDRDHLHEGIGIMSNLLGVVRNMLDHQILMNNYMEDLSSFFHEGKPPEEALDIFKIVTLFKPGFGPNLILNKERRQYMRVQAGVATACNISSPMGPPFVVTIPAVTLPNQWNPFDFPDMSSIYLDSTASANQMNIYVRYTNVPPAN